jgi:hypothetical protein
MGVEPLENLSQSTDVQIEIFCWFVVETDFCKK